MDGYTSVGHATSNEVGEEQVTLEYRLGFYEHIYSRFKARKFKVPDTRTEEWVMEDDRWVGKYSRTPANYEKYLEICRVKDYFHFTDAYWDRKG